jgi:hypothetical protein
LCLSLAPLADHWLTMHCENCKLNDVAIWSKQAPPHQIAARCHGRKHLLSQVERNTLLALCPAPRLPRRLLYEVYQEFEGRDVELEADKEFIQH